MLTNLFKKTISVLKFLIFICVLVSSIGLSAQSLGQEREAVLHKLSQGQIISLPDFIANDFSLIAFDKMVIPGPQFLISDDPEYISVPEAIAMQEMVEPGAVRLYVYNVNGVKDPVKMDRKIVAVLKNMGSETMNFRMLKYSSQKPSSNYFKIGKEGLYDYLKDAKTTRPSIQVKPGEVISIDSELDKNIVNYDELVHGFYEFVVDQPAQVSVVQLDPKTPSIEALNKVKNVLPPKTKSGAGRGKFGVSNYKIKGLDVLNTNKGAFQLIVADGDMDPWIKGQEGVTGNSAELAGNYGVMYDIELEWESVEGRGLALVTWNSRSADNKWCGGMAASMKVSEGKFPEDVIQLPSDQLVTKGDPEAILIQMFVPEKGVKTQNIKITYSPPGASCLPMPLIFVPVDLPK